MNKKQKKLRNRILVALGIFIVMEILEVAGVFESLPYGVWIEFVAFLIPYLIAGYDVLAKAWHGITHKQPFDENLLMAIATIGAFALVFFPEAEPHMAEGAAVMLFYQVGSLFESYAVGKTRKSISDMMDIAPDFANLVGEDGEITQVDPFEVAVGSKIVVKAGERVPLDGIVLSGQSQLDTSALTGESVPRVVEEGAEVISGCVNMTGMLTIETTSAAENSTVQRILELVENASEKKSRSENFISRFARVYTPIVVGLALLIALICPFLGFSISKSVESALVFLVVSCPCALVISVPLSFFGGIGAASRQGILVKGSSYLEALSEVDTIAFDKTGTLTSGKFGVVAVHAHGGVGSHAAHGDAHVGAHEHRCVVHAVADERDPAFHALVVGQKFLDSSHLVLRHELRADLVYAQLAAHGIGDFLAVARQHDGRLHAGGMQAVDGFLGVVFHHVGDDDVAQVLAVDRHVQDGADELAVVVELLFGFHEPVVADEHAVLVHGGGHALARDLFDVVDFVVIDHAGIAFHDRKRDGMVGIRLGMSRVRQKQVLVDAAMRVHGHDAEPSARERARLVEGDSVDFGKHLEVARTLHQNALAA